MDDALPLDVLCLGAAGWDVTLQVTAYPEPDSKEVAESMVQCGGGPASNAAVCVSRLGGRSGFAGYLGSDAFGDLHLRELEREGVDTAGVIRGNAPTPFSVVIAQPDGRRALVNHSAPGAKASAAIQLPPKPPRVMLFDGREVETAKEWMAYAKRHDVTTVLDAGSLHTGTELLAPDVDYLVCSEKFARQVSGCKNRSAAFSAVCDMTRHVVVMTVGAAGLFWYSRGQSGECPAFAVDAVDTTGAGDAFHGAFAYCLAIDMTFDGTLRFASAAAALTCSARGARMALPARDAVERLLAE